MAASEHVNNYLFNDAFTRTHGMSVEQALRGNLIRVDDGSGNKFMSPEEYQEHWKGTKKYSTTLASQWREQHQASIAPTDVTKTIRRFQGNYGTSEILVGNPSRVAAELRDLTHLVRSEKRVNDISLYRGARRDPELDIGTQEDNLLSFSEDHRVAKTFANQGSRGLIYKAAPGTVEGIPVNQFGGVRRTVGKNNREEREWLITPESFIKFKRK